MRLATAMLAALLVTTGCLRGSQDPVDDLEDPVALGALAFEPAVALPNEPIGAEPNIVVGPDGAVWVIAPGALVTDANIQRAAVSIWRSADQGQTWTMVMDPGEQNPDGAWCSCDADIDVAPDGTVYITDFYVGQPPSGGLPINGFVVQSSVDDGASWSDGNFVTVTSPAANDRQYITAGADAGVVYLAYNGAGLTPALGSTPPGAPGPGLQMWRSADDGLTFTQRSSVVTGSQASGILISKHRVAPDGTVHQPWMQAEAEIGSVFTEAAVAKLGVSTDDGLTFTHRTIGFAPNGTGGLWPLQVDLGPDGMLHAAWMERRPAGGSQIWYASSADAGASWTEQRVVGWTAGTAVLPWISHAGPGRAAIAYYGTADEVVPLSAPDTTRWDLWVSIVGADPALEAPSRASPYPVKVGVFCPEGASCPHDRELLDYPGVAWRDGWVHVVYGVSILDEGAGEPGGRASGPQGGHDSAAIIHHARARLR